MGTVSATAVSRIDALDSTTGVSFTSIGGGAGAGTNDDIFIQGDGSVGRWIDNKTSDFGFLINDGAGTDLSGAGVHVGMWLWLTHVPAVTVCKMLLASGSTAGVRDEHTLPLTDIPETGGWVKIWIDVSRTPEGGDNANEASIQYYGSVIQIGDITGTADNLIIDAMDHTTTGLSLTGTAGDWEDFTTADDNSSNRYGVCTLQSGITFVRARLTLGTATSLVFDDADFTIAFPQQSLVNDTFMGITIDLQNASTNVDWARGVVNSPGAKKGDMVVTGTSGAFDAVGCSFNGLRLVTLTSACTITNSAFNGCGAITGASATLTGTAVNNPNVAADSSGLIWNVNEDPDGNLDDMIFDDGGTDTHAIEFGTSSPLTMTLRGVDFTGYSASDAVNNSTFRFLRTTGTITLNLIGCSGNFSFKKEAGATVNIVNNPVTTSAFMGDSETKVGIEGVAVTLWTNGSGPYPYDATVTITRSGSTASVSHTAHGMSNGQKVRLRGAVQNEYNRVKTISNVSTDAYDFTVSGTPTTPATGTIKADAVIIDGLTNASGNISDNRVFGTDQAVTGFAAKGTSSPIYSRVPLADTIDSANGLAITQLLISDE